MLQTEAWMMRGLDYNTEHHAGIGLLIAKPCSSRRAYIQALGRVGRYGTQCKRYLLGNAVDPWKEKLLGFKVAAELAKIRKTT